MNYDEIIMLRERLEDLGGNIIYGDANSVMIRGGLEYIRDLVEEYRENYQNQEYYIDVDVLYSDDVLTWYSPVLMASPQPVMCDSIVCD